MNYWTGNNEDYFWFEAEDLQFWKVIETMPELVLDNYVMINAFDSGPLKWTDEELSKGFGYKNEVAVTTKLTNLNDLVNLPSEFYDEWFIRSKPFDNTPAEIFVNYGLFTLRTRSFEEEKKTMDMTWDFKGREYEIEILTELQEKFWAQIKMVDADKFMGQHDNHFLFVTKDKNEIETLVKHAR